MQTQPSEPPPAAQASKVPLGGVNTGSQGATPPRYKESTHALRGGHVH